MAFMDKLGKVANKVGEVASDTIDYSKAKGKILLEKGKITDGKEALGDYVYNTLAAGETLDMAKITVLCDDIDVHVQNIRELEEEARQSGEDIADEFR